MTDRIVTFLCFIVLIVFIRFGMEFFGYQSSSTDANFVFLAVGVVSILYILINRR